MIIPCLGPSMNMLFCKCIINLHILIINYDEYIVIIKSYCLLYFCICVIDFKSLVRRNWMIVMCHEEDVRRDDFGAIILDVKTGMANVAIKKINSIDRSWCYSLQQSFSLGNRYWQRNIFCRLFFLPSIKTIRWYKDILLL